MTDDIEQQLRPLLKKGTTVLSMSAQAHQGVTDVISHLYTMVTSVRDEEIEEKKQSEDVVEEGVEVFSLTSRQLQKEWHVTKKRNKYVVTGERIEDFANKTFFDDFHSLQRLQDIMRRFGIIHELDKQGYEDGQEIIFGDPEIGRMNL